MPKVKARKPEKVYVFFKDYHEDGGDKVVEATEEEWQALIAPAVAHGYPIDGGTVDSEMFGKLYDRPDVPVKLSEVAKTERVVPLV